MEVWLDAWLDGRMAGLLSWFLNVDGCVFTELRKYDKEYAHCAEIASNVVM